MEVDKSTANEAKQNDGKAECDGNVDNNSEGTGIWFEERC